MHCGDPWSILVLSPAEDRVTACCDYTEHGEALFRPDGSVNQIQDMWNGPLMQVMRRVQAGRVAAPHGCSACALSFDSPDALPAPGFEQYASDAVSPEQRANLALAREDYEAKAETVRALPIKLVVFFGWGCNLQCRICNQVPSRDSLQGKLPAGTYQLWREAMRVASVVECLGGEPFSLPAGLDFMRSFAADRDMDHVRMLLTTNGTLLARHLDWLKAKPRVSFNVSIDSVGAGYESVRVGGKWDVVEANLRKVRAIAANENPLWKIGVNALMTKTGIYHLPDYARFLVDADIHSSFHALRPTRGIEETLYQEDILRYPRLLDQVPDWQHRMAEAEAILRDGNFSTEADTIAAFALRLRGVNSPSGQPEQSLRLMAAIDGPDIERVIVGQLGTGAIERLGHAFRSANVNDGLVLGINFHGTLPSDGMVTIRLIWTDSAIPKGQRLSHAVFYDQPDFSLIRWNHAERDGGASKSLTVSVNGQRDEPKRLMIGLMNAQAGAIVRLPDRLEILGI